MDVESKEEDPVNSTGLCQTGQIKLIVVHRRGSAGVHRSPLVYIILFRKSTPYLILFIFNLLHLYLNEYIIFNIIY